MPRVSLGVQALAPRSPHTNQPSHVPAPPENTHTHQQQIHTCRLEESSRATRAQVQGMEAALACKVDKASHLKKNGVCGHLTDLIMSGKECVCVCVYLLSFAFKHPYACTYVVLAASL